MSEQTMSLAREGFGAWQRGDFATLEAMLDPRVQWRWFEPGEWNCNSRDDVMRTLRERYEQGFAASELEFLDAGEDSVIVVAHPAAVGGEGWPEETATVITFRHGKVTTMQDHRTSADALEAVRPA
jgi:ketosteroid isomerase-like protein